MDSLIINPKEPEQSTSDAQIETLLELKKLYQLEIEMKKADIKAIDLKIKILTIYSGTKYEH